MKQILAKLDALMERHRFNTTSMVPSDVHAELLQIREALEDLDYPHEVPVVINFDNGQQIGMLLIDTDKLPLAPDFCFTLGYSIEQVPDEKIPSKPYTGPYKLISICPTNDLQYVKYLKQVGVITQKEG